MEPLPDEFAVALGRLLFWAGHVDMLIDRVLSPHEGPVRRLGHSGAPLVAEMRRASHLLPHEVVDGYERMYGHRNMLVHGAHSFANGILWTWYEPVRARGAAARSFQHSREDLEGFAQSWERLATAVEMHLHSRDSQ